LIFNLKYQFFNFSSFQARLHPGETNGSWMMQVNFAEKNILKILSGFDRIFDWK